MARTIYIYDDMPVTMIPILEGLSDAEDTVKRLALEASSAFSRGDFITRDAKAIEYQDAVDQVDSLYAQAIEQQNKIKADAIKEATKFDIAEVVAGIPKALVNEITEDMLPCVYTEPEPEPIENPTPIAEEIANIKARLGIVESIEPVDLSPIMADITDVKGRLATLEKPTPKEV